jgi:hypothetical protein
MSEYHKANIKKSLYKYILSSTIYRSLNYEAANFYKRRSKFLNIAIITLSSVSGSLNFTNLGLDFVSGSLSFCVTLMTVIKTFMKYDEKYQIHFNNFKEFREVISQADLLMTDDDISDENFKKVELLYENVLERMPPFDENFIDNFKKDNMDFIREASKNGLVPDILTDYDSLVEGSLFNIYGHFTNKYNPSDSSIKKNTFRDIVLSRLHQIRKLEEKEKEIKEKSLKIEKEEKLSMNSKTFSGRIEVNEVIDNEEGIFIPDIEKSLLTNSHNKYNSV